MKFFCKYLLLLVVFTASMTVLSSTSSAAEQISVQHRGWYVAENDSCTSSPRLIVYSQEYEFKWHLCMVTKNKGGGKYHFQCDSSPELPLFKEGKWSMSKTGEVEYLTISDGSDRISFKRCADSVRN